MCRTTMTRFFFCLEVLLRRPDKDKYRLDHLLQRKAREGVKIYIIL
jgi:phospholipase D1/2